MSYSVKTEGLVALTAYLTGDPYLYFKDNQGVSGAWNPQYGTHAPESTAGQWVAQHSTMSVPTTAGTASVVLAFAGSSWQRIKHSHI